MSIRIDLNDGTPIYQQVVSQLRYQIASGQRELGSELPTIRALALQLKINPNTVARAYRELEQEGVVEKRSTHGTFVSGRGSPMTKSHKRTLIEDRIDQLLALSRQLGFPLAEVQAMLADRDSKMKPTQGHQK